MDSIHSPNRRNRTDTPTPSPARPAKVRETKPQDMEFHETLAAPVPNRTYRSEVDLTESRTATAEQAVRYIAAILTGLLAIRFVISLFTSDRSNGLVNFFYALTDWLVRPFQMLLGQVPSNSSTNGYFDWAALAAMATVLILATLLIRFIRRPKV